MPSTTVIAVALSAVLLGLAALHIFWAFGGRQGAAAAIPEIRDRPAFAPSRMGTLGVAAALIAAAIVVLARADLILTSAPRCGSRWLATSVGVVFVLRSIGEFRLVGFFKSVRNTRFARWDTWVYSPLCSLLGLGALWLGWR